MTGTTSPGTARAPDWPEPIRQMHEWKKYNSRPDGPVKHCSLINSKAEYDTSWNQSMAPGHIRIEIDGETPYGCDLREFANSHRFDEKA